MFFIAQSTNSDYEDDTKLLIQWASEETDKFFSIVFSLCYRTHCLTLRQPLLKRSCSEKNDDYNHRRITSNV